MQLFKKKTFSELFAPILKSKSNFENFEEKADLHSLCISEFKDGQIPGSMNF